MKTLLLAVRNLLRNRRRSLTTLFAMIVGVTAILLFGGYIRDINLGLQTGYVQRSGHLQLQHKDFFLYGTGNPAAYGIDHYKHIIEVVRADPVLAPMLTVVTPTLQLGGIGGNFAKGVSRTVFATGVVVDEQNRLREWNDYNFRGVGRPLALTGTADDTAVVGTGVARVLDLCEALNVPHCVTPKTADATGAAMPTDVAALATAEKAAPSSEDAARIEILAASAHGAPNVAGVKVVKAEYQGVKELDDVYVAMHLPTAQRLIYGRETPEVSAIILQLKHTSEMPAARARLEELLKTTFKDEPLEIQDFGTLNPFYGQTLAMFAAIFGFIALLIGAIVLFTITNTMSMAVVERTAEIGTLRAIGVRRGGIRSLFLTEGVLLGIVGAIAGVIISVLLAAALNAWGLSWTPPGRVEPVPLTIRVWGGTALMLGTAIGLVFVASLSALFPAQRAGRMNIVDALRHA